MFEMMLVIEMITNVFLKEFGFIKKDRRSDATERHEIKSQLTLNNTVSKEVFNICYFLQDLCMSLYQPSWFGVKCSSCCHQNENLNF